MAGTYGLGQWQLSRAAYKERLQAELQARSTLEPLGNEGLRTLTDPGQAVHRPAVVRGRWLPQHQVFLDNRPQNGRVGWVVVAPFELAGEGPGPAPVLLVQRGWAPRDFLDRTQLPPVATPPGDQSVQGRLALGPSKLYEMGPTDSGRIRQNLDIQAFSRETGLNLLPYTLLQTGAPSEGLSRDWPPPAFGVDKHYGYAFQWFALSALTALLYVGYLYRGRAARPQSAA
ncbi:MAG: SURF1 family protein [Rhodoferax sp.]|nr:SURF1 family protein [Rhodoferax sp.]